MAGTVAAARSEEEQPTGGGGRTHAHVRGRAWGRLAPEPEPSRVLGHAGQLGLFHPCLHRVKELNLQEQQLQLDQELRGYMNQEGRWATGRRWCLPGLVTSDTDRAMQASGPSASEAFQEEAGERGSEPLLCLRFSWGCTAGLVC